MPSRKGAAAGLVAYMVLVVFLHGVCSLLEVRFSDVSAYLTLAFLTDFLYNERWKTASRPSEIRIDQKADLTLAVRQVGPDHFTCRLGDIKKLESGWMLYPKEGPVCGPFPSIHQAMESMADQYFEKGGA